MWIVSSRSHREDSSHFILKRFTHSHLMPRPTPTAKLNCFPTASFGQAPNREARRTPQAFPCTVLNIWHLPWGMAGLAFFAGATSSALDSEKDAVLLGAGV